MWMVIMPNVVDLEEQSYAIPRTLGDGIASNPAREPWQYSVEHYYADVSAVYDHLYNDNLSLQENDHIAERLRNVGDRVLDLGCGTGLGLTLLPRDDIAYMGIDICPRMVAKAERLGSYCKVFRVGNMEKLDVASGAMTDVISLFGSFSHCEHPEAVIDEAYRVLQPGGRLLLMAYSRYSLARIYRFEFGATGGYCIRRSAQIGKPAPARFYTPRELRKLVERRFSRVSVAGLTTIAQLHPSAGITRLDLILARIWPSLAHSLIVEAVKPNAQTLPRLQRIRSSARTNTRALPAR